MKIWHRTLFVLITIILLVGCGSNQITGNGKQVTKTRRIQDFNQVKISGAYRVEIIQDGMESLKITTDSNIIPLVITEVKGNQLNIHNKAGVSFSLTQPVLIQIAVKQLTHIVASGDNQLFISHYNGKKLLMDTNGSVQAKLSGKVEEFDLQISGSGDINAMNLAAKDVKVRLIGSGDVKVNATDTLNTKITGNGTIKYLGDPANVDQSIVGSGTLMRVK